ncbi:MAG: HlyD family efflux transporter periplasmic adaptor subunit [Lachnospiraceae bacterium]
MKKKKNKKIVKFHKISQLNIGVIIFGIIFIYMMYNIVQYFTTSHVSVYEVSQGNIAQNNIFTGLILRDEIIYTTEASGYINYYNKDATKAGVNTYVYSIDETGDFYNQITAQNQGQLFSTDRSYDEIEKTASNYVTEYSNEDFYKVYSFQYDMEAALMEALGKNALSNIGANANTATFHSYLAPQAGIVVYNIDGLEGITLDSFTLECFDASTHIKNNLMARKTVEAGDAAYKLLPNEHWNLILPIKPKFAEDLSKETNIQVKFKKDNSTAWGNSQIIERDGSYFLVLSFQNSEIRFAQERYLEVELLLSDTSGLKIPNSSLTEKSFWTIPKDFITKGGDSNENGVLRQTKDKDGKTVMEFTQATVFQENETNYCIDGSELKKGDIIIKPDSNEAYTLTETAKLQGVYNINKGYAIFRKVELLFQNEEYAIVKNNTSYGISLYDHIALDASAVKEDQMIQ